MLNGKRSNIAIKQLTQIMIVSRKVTLSYIERRIIKNETINSVAVFPVVNLIKASINVSRQMKSRKATKGNNSIRLSGKRIKLVISHVSIDVDKIEIIHLM